MSKTFLEFSTGLPQSASATLLDRLVGIQDGANVTFTVGVLANALSGSFVTSAATAGAIPVMASGNAVANSPLTVSGGNVSASGSLSAASDSSFNNVRIGRGAGNVTTNTVVGWGALALNTTAYGCTAIGFEALATNTTAISNTAVGYSDRSPRIEPVVACAVV